MRTARTSARTATFRYSESARRCTTHPVAARESAAAAEFPVWFAGCPVESGFLPRAHELVGGWSCPPTGDLWTRDDAAMTMLSAALVQGLAEYVSLSKLNGLVSDAEYMLRTTDSETFIKVGIVFVVLLAFSVNRIRIR